MNNRILIFVWLIVLLGCDHTVKFNPNLGYSPDDKATVVFYLENGKGLFNPSVSFPIIANDVEIASLDSGQSVTKYLQPGSYKLHSQTSSVDRISDLTFEKGNIYYVKVWVELGMWAHSVRFTLTDRPEKI